MAIRLGVRCDASIEIGSGHVSRCGALARALAARGAEIRFLGDARMRGMLFDLETAGFSLLCGESEAELLERAVPLGLDLIVFDHYGLGAREETAYRRAAPLLVAIDDVAGRPHDVDILIDPMPGARADAYAGLVPARCDVRCGAAWLLLKPEFSRLRGPSLKRRGQPGPVERVFVGLGGTDPLALAPEVLAALERSGVEAQVDLALGSGSPSLEATRRAAASSALDVRLRIDARDVAKLMAGADMAVGAGGVMAWERCALGLPSIALILADNQQAVGPYFDRTGAGVAIDVRAGLDRAALADACARLAADPHARAEMSRRAAAVCDARGAERAADLLIGAVRRASA